MKQTAVCLPGSVVVIYCSLTLISFPIYLAFSPACFRAAYPQSAVGVELSSPASWVRAVLSPFDSKDLLLASTGV